MNQYGFVSKFWDPSQKRRGRSRPVRTGRGSSRFSWNNKDFTADAVFFWRRHTLIYSGLFAPQPLKLCRIITSGCLAKSCLNADQLHLKFEQTNQTSQRNVLGTGKLEKLWWKKKSIKSLKVKLKILLISS